MRMQPSCLFLRGLCVLLATAGAAAPLSPTHAPHVMVASIHELASRPGVEMLRAGGMVDFSLNIAGAVNAPRFHNQWLPDEILVEDRLSPDTMNILGSKGHTLKVEHFWGDGECIMIDPNTGERLGASDGRNYGKAVGY